MAKLKLERIICHRANDEYEDDPVFDIGIEDEPQIFVGNERVWSGRIDPNSEKDLSMIKLIPFTDSVRVSLVERDAGYSINEDDLLGEVTVYANVADAGIQQVHFNKKSSRYTLEYSILG